MRPSVRVILVACAVVASTALPTSTASADPGLCDNPPQSGDTAIKSLVSTPSNVVVGPHKTVTQSFTAVVTDSCPIEVGLSNFLYFGGPVWDDPRTIPFAGGTKDGDTWTFVASLDWDPTKIPNTYATSWTPELFAYGSGYDDVYEAAITVQHASHLTANAAPEPVRVGKRLSVRGTLKTADWEKGAWVGHADQAVQLQYRPKKGSWATVQTVTSAATGVVKAKTTATTSGCYRFVYGGDETDAAVTSGSDCVRVTR